MLVGMTKLRLIRLDCNYSSWSMRGWLMLRQTGQPFEEIYISPLEADWREKLRSYSPTGKVPALLVGDDFLVWESLAIGEFLNERYPGCELWPFDPHQRARARSLACEMHAGFPKIRELLPMDVRSRHHWHPLSEELASELERLEEIWSQAQGPYLFGHFGIVDAMFAPMATRLRTYGLFIPGTAGRYTESLLRHPDVELWSARAETEESEVVPGLNGPASVRRRPGYVSSSGKGE